MDLISTRTIEISSLALDGLSSRHKAISSNIANAETPDYKRVDVTFEDQLAKIINTGYIKESIKLANSAGKAGNVPSEAQGVQSQTPLTVNKNQALMEISDFKPQTIDSDDNPANENGNTVNIEQEMSALTKNGMSYTALATLQAKEFRTLSEIIKGGGGGV